MPNVQWTPALEKKMAPLYEKVKDAISPLEWPFMAPYIEAINTLKKERNAVILAHNYQTPEIFHGVADVVGDSLQLAREAARVNADIIIQCGVHFMAETAKILNPEKCVLIPDSRAGCSLAESITGADVRRLREIYPGVPIIAYVNTSAEVKAEVDVCCTSSNAVTIVNALKVPRVLVVPDKYLAHYVASQTSVEVIAWEGACEVHEQFTGAELENYKRQDPSVSIVAHPECPPDVIAQADFTGSTAHMIQWVEKHNPKRVILVTECSMSDNIRTALPDVTFLQPCRLCPHMKRITLPKILNSLLNISEEVIVPPLIAQRARQSVERMIALSH
jgi:quinolinate synthase